MDSNVCYIFWNIVIGGDHLFVVEGEDMQEHVNMSVYEEAEFGLHSTGSGT